MASSASSIISFSSTASGHPSHLRPNEIILGTLLDLQPNDGEVLARISVMGQVHEILLPANEALTLGKEVLILYLDGRYYVKEAMPHA